MAFQSTVPRRRPWRAAMLGAIIAFAPQGAGADAFRSCVGAAMAEEKIARCGEAIRSEGDPRRLERAYLRRGNAFAESGRFAEAVEDFSALVRLNPAIAGYYDNRGRALKELGRFSEALRDALIAVRISPQSAFVYRSRGEVYDAMNRPDLAVADYSHGLDIEPGNVGLRVDRGKALAKLGRNGEAEADFAAAIAQDPASAIGYRERGLFYRALGDPRAAADLAEAVRIDPSDWEAASALEGTRAGLKPR